MKINSLADLERIKAEYKEKLSKYKYQVLVCGGAGCISSNCGAVKEALINCLSEKDLLEQVAVIETGCMGICAVGPVLLIMPDETFYVEINPDKMVEIVESHILNGTIKEEYTYFDRGQGRYIPHYSEIDFFKDQVKIALRNCGVIDYSSIHAYIARDGYFAAAKVLEDMSAEVVIDEIKKSGLRGRGGGKQE